MGLEMFQLQTKLVDQLHSVPFQLKETNMRLMFGLGVMLLYLLIGAVVFTTLESPYEAADAQYIRAFTDEYRARIVGDGSDACQPLSGKFLIFIENIELIVWVLMLNKTDKKINAARVINLPMLTTLM